MLKTALEEFYLVTKKQSLFEFECEIYGSKVGKTWSNYIFHLKKLCCEIFYKTDHCEGGGGGNTHP
jgi:hypothetical protein